MELAKKQYRGFTLIELFIVMAIIVTLATLSWTALADSKKKTVVSNACESVTSMVNKARSYALVGVVGANSVRINCSATNCRIQKFTVSTNSWSLVNGEVIYPLVGSSITPFIVQYPIPYASTASGTGITGSDPVVTLTGNVSITKTVVIDPFKALCQ